MKSNNALKEIIKKYLDQRAQSDELFAVTYAKEEKNIDECCSYITKRAKQMQTRGCAVIPDEDVFGWAVHYYDEDDIKIEKDSNMQTTVNHSAKKLERREEKPKQKKKEDINQLSLF